MPTNNKNWVGLTVGQLCADFMSAFGITGLSATSLAQMNKVFQLIQMGYLDEIKEVLRQVAANKVSHGKPKKADSIKLKKEFKSLLKCHSSNRPHPASVLMAKTGTAVLYIADGVEYAVIEIPAMYQTKPFVVRLSKPKGLTITDQYGVYVN
jgi:hypothetical protein